MKFTAKRRLWWTREAATREHSLEGRWLPLLGLGGLLTALIFSAWRFGPAAEEVPGDVSAAANDAGPADFHQLPAIQIRLRADAAGRLASIAFNGRPVKDVADLRAEIRAFLGPAAADATVEAELDCDGHLRYEHTQQIITAISACPGGRRPDDGSPGRPGQVLAAENREAMMYAHVLVTLRVRRTAGNARALPAGGTSLSLRRA